MAVKDEDKECICCYTMVYQSRDSMAPSEKARKSSVNSNATASEAAASKAASARLCCCCGCCLIKLSVPRILELTLITVCIASLLLNFAYIGMHTFYINSLSRNVISGAISCGLMLYFGGCTIMLIFRNSGVSRFRKIAMFIIFICWMGYLLPLAFLQPTAAALASSDFWLFDTGSEGPSSSVNPFNFKTWLFQIYPEWGKQDIQTFKYKENLPATPTKDGCDSFSRDYHDYLELDLHLPQNATMGAGTDGKFAVLFHIHGGAWQYGDKSDDALDFEHFTSRGYAVVSSQYSLVCHGATVADMTADLTDAYKYVNAHADEWSLDMDRVTAMGSSAGGHLALLMAYTTKKADNTTNAFRSAFNTYGPSDFVKWDEEGFTSGGTNGWSFDCDGEDSLMQDLAGGCTPAELEAISPVNFIDANSPPTITIHGTMDSLVPFDQSVSLHKKLDNAGVDNYLIQVRGWDHMLDIGYFGPQQLERYALQRLLAVDSLKPVASNGDEEAWGWGVYVAVGMSIVFGLISAAFMHLLDKWQESNMPKTEAQQMELTELRNSDGNSLNNQL
jgi:acetyl esterase/lipase